jgi:hypothetical protein
MDTDRSTDKSAERRWSDAINPAQQTAFAVAFIALLLMLNFILRFPDLGAIIAEYNRF